MEHHCNFVAQAQSGGSIIIITIGVVWCGVVHAESNLGFVAYMYGMHTCIHVTCERCTSSSPPSAREETRLTSSAIVKKACCGVGGIEEFWHKG